MKTFSQLVAEAHGDPYDRGSADAHYGRQRNPHKKDARGNRVHDLTPEEKKAYHKGYDETDRMDLD